LKIAQAKLRAIASAERSLKWKLETIDWRETELADALDNVQKLAALGQTPEITMVEGGGILKRLAKASDGDSQG